MERPSQHGAACSGRPLAPCPPSPRSSPEQRWRRGIPTGSSDALGGSSSASANLIIVTNELRHRFISYLINSRSAAAARSVCLSPGAAARVTGGRHLPNAVPSPAAIWEKICGRPDPINPAEEGWVALQGAGVRARSSV